MKKAPLIIVVAVLAVISLLLQREFLRGTFDPVERAFTGWLAANTGAKDPLPPLTLVLYDEESSHLAGTSRMGTLDVALFARAASRLGAIAAGVEGLPGDPSRMMEAAGRLPVFAGYDPENPPGMGWTPWGGVTGQRWMELRGVAGPASTRLPRGFFTVAEGEAGPQHALMVARNADRVVPSFLSLCWAAAQRVRSPECFAEDDRVTCAGRSLPIDSGGRTSFFPSPPSGVMTMSGLLVAAEKFERGEEQSLLRGHVVVLARATSDIARLKISSEGEATTPPEIWSISWQAVRKGRCFVLPGWWYQVFLVAVGVGLSLVAGRHTRFACVFTGVAATLVYLLVALGTFASSGILLPFVLSVGTLAAGLFLGRLFPRI